MNHDILYMFYLVEDIFRHCAGRLKNYFPVHLKNGRLCSNKQWLAAINKCKQFSDPRFRKK